MTRVLDPLQVAWAAGLIEGEGCIQASVRSQTASQGRYLHHRVRVVMADRDVVERLVAVFGIGKASPYFPKTGLGTKPLFRWDASRRADVIMVCDAIYPWMGDRRRAAIDNLRRLLIENPPVSGSERCRRTWLTRRAKMRAAA
jgi:hypothetical protein